MTPLITAVDQVNYEIFRMLLEIHHYIDSIPKSKKILPQIINKTDDKGESALIKAVRTDKTEMIYSLLHLGSDIITYDVLSEDDSQKKNILHHAVTN